MLTRKFLSESEFAICITFDTCWPMDTMQDKLKRYVVVNGPLIKSCPVSSYPQSLFLEGTVQVVQSDTWLKEKRIFPSGLGGQGKPIMQFWLQNNSYWITGYWNLEERKIHHRMLFSPYSGSSVPTERHSFVSSSAFGLLVMARQNRWENEWKCTNNITKINNFVMHVLNIW